MAPQNVPGKLRYLQTRGPPRMQTVQEILGEAIGRVPRNICSVTSQGMALGHIIEGSCMHTGGTNHGGPGSGGGPQLIAAYILEFPSTISYETISQYVTQLRHYIPEDQLYL